MINYMDSTVILALAKSVIEEYRQEKQNEITIGCPREVALAHAVVHLLETMNLA